MQRPAHLGGMIFVHIPVAPDVELIVLAAPELKLDGIEAVVPLIVQVDGPVSVVRLLALSQVYHPEIVGKFVWIRLQMQAEPQDIVAAQPEAAAGAQRLFIFSPDGIVAFEAGPRKALRDQRVDIALPVLGDVLQDGLQRELLQGDLRQTFSKGGPIGQGVKGVLGDKRSRFNMQPPFLA